MGLAEYIPQQGYQAVFPDSDIVNISKKKLQERAYFVFCTATE